MYNDTLTEHTHTRKTHTVHARIHTLPNIAQTHARANHNHIMTQTNKVQGTYNIQLLITRLNMKVTTCSIQMIHEQTVCVVLLTLIANRFRIRIFDSHVYNPTYHQFENILKSCMV